MKAGSLILQWCRVPLQYNECKHKNGKHHTGLEGDVSWVAVFVTENLPVHKPEHTVYNVYHGIHHLPHHIPYAVECHQEWIHARLWLR